MIVSVNIFQVWNKEDHARKLLFNRKELSIASVDDEQQNNDLVSETLTSMNRFGIHSVKFRVQMIRRILAEKCTTLPSGSLSYPNNKTEDREAMMNTVFY